MRAKYYLMDESESSYVTVHIQAWQSYVTVYSLLCYGPKCISNPVSYMKTRSRQRSLTTQLYSQKSELSNINEHYGSEYPPWIKFYQASKNEMKLPVNVPQVKKLRHMTSVGKLKCCSVQQVLVQQRNRGSIENNSSFVHTSWDLDPIPTWHLKFCLH